jgi:hypothetical protein
MAAGYLPAPEPEGVGPCAGECAHTDCAATRRLAALICRHCDKPIGYEIAYYQNGDWTELEHALCAHLAADKRRKEMAATPTPSED